MVHRRSDSPYGARTMLGSSKEKHSIVIAGKAGDRVVCLNRGTTGDLQASSDETPLTLVFL